MRTHLCPQHSTEPEDRTTRVTSTCGGAPPISSVPGAVPTPGFPEGWANRSHSPPSAELLLTEGPKRPGHYGTNDQQHKSQAPLRQGGHSGSVTMLHEAKARLQDFFAWPLPHPASFPLFLLRTAPQQITDTQPPVSDSALENPG